ncbi:uncharacterized protein [Zea mays]|uniref:Uncharacterized protein n=1 Tax=Zea mays TaxID=4577 RepID=C0PMA0_MAIZE|nr:uncharacterized protein LOC118476082 [Zea mays]ACN36316.1 unknown [Zea mays]
MRIRVDGGATWRRWCGLGGSSNYGRLHALDRPGVSGCARARVRRRRAGNPCRGASCRFATCWRVARSDLLLCFSLRLLLADNLLVAADQSQAPSIASDGLDTGQRHRRQRGRGHQLLAPDHHQRRPRGALADAEARAFGWACRCRCRRVASHRKLAPLLGLRGSGAAPLPGVPDAAVVLDDDVREGGREAGLDRERPRRAH